MSKPPSHQTMKDLLQALVLGLLIAVLAVSTLELLAVLPAIP